jgi:late competence protein required for DNA uptake (superfamily II DNA/RNA helicase)
MLERLYVKEMLEDGEVNAVESPNETCILKGKIRCSRMPCCWKERKDYFNVRDSTVYCYFR